MYRRSNKVYESNVLRIYIYNVTSIQKLCSSLKRSIFEEKKLLNLADNTTNYIVITSSFQGYFHLSSVFLFENNVILLFITK